MPLDLSTRRERGFRPLRYTPRHRLAVMMYAQGKSRGEIARHTGYSVSHISRIIGMEEARKDIDRAIKELRETVLAQMIAELIPSAEPRQRRQSME